MKRRTKASVFLRALCLLACAAVALTISVSCGRKKMVEPRPAQTGETSGFDRTDDGDESRDPKDERDARHVIVIDPGHGADDAGFTSQYTAQSEARIALNFSLRLNEILTERGYTVYLTRGENTFARTKADDGDGVFDDYERAAYANECKAEYFLSVHTAIYEDDGAQDVSGSRVYVSSAAKAGKSAVRLAGEQLCSAFSGKAMGESQFSLVVTPEYDSYRITALADGVSLLLMLGYMSNERDVMNMIDPAWIDLTANRTADGIDAYFLERGIMK